MVENNNGIIYMVSKSKASRASTHAPIPHTLGVSATSLCNTPREKSLKAIENFIVPHGLGMRSFTTGTISRGIPGSHSPISDDIFDTLFGTILAKDTTPSTSVVVTTVSVPKSVVLPIPPSLRPKKPTKKHAKKHTRKTKRRVTSRSTRSG